MEDMTAPQTWSQKAKEKSHESRLLHVTGWSMCKTKKSKYTSNVFFLKDGFCHFSISYHIDLCLRLHFSGQHSYPGYFSFISGWRDEVETCPPS